MENVEEKKNRAHECEEEGCHCHDHDHEEEGCHCHDHDHEEEGCHCHDHDHDHEEEGCHCHDHDHDHEEEGCHCHDHDHDEDGCGCGCGCGHDHGEEKEESVGKTVLRYALGALPVILGFLPFLPTPLRMIASVAGYLLFGFSVWRDMLRGMKKKQIFTEFTLMCVASLGAFAIGEYADAAAVMYLYSLGETLSDRAYSKSKKSISELLEILPEYATVLRDGEAVRVSPEDVSVGETILVVAGERIPLDGVVCEGGGSADTSSVTGEATPLELYEGVFCPSGAILRDGSVRLTVTQAYENGVVAKLSEAVRQASRRKSAAEKKITRFARIFTPLAFGIALAVFLVGWLITGNLREWLHMALVILVVSCPCSLVLSVPLTYFAGIGAGAARGIVFRGGEIMDSMCRLRTVAFDKTGTVTESVLSFDGAEVYGDVDEEEFLSLARDVLTHSPHAAAVSFCRSRGGELCHTVTEVENVGGRGIACLVDGKRAAFGNAAWMRAQGLDLADSPTTVIFGAVEGVLLGKLNFSAHVKAGSALAVSALRKEGIERIVLLSGDGAASVADACRQIGIEEYYAPLTPAEKSEKFEGIACEERKKAPRATAAFCGDGLNDSAVIAGADIGVAMGGCGAALTVQSADVVLMEDNPERLCDALRLAKRTSRIAGQNIVLSLGIKIAVVAVGVVLSATTGNEIPMGLAIVADVGAALLAVLNALRARR